MFLFEKSEKNVQFNSLFLGIPKIFICVRVKQMAFLSEDWKKLSVWTEGWKKVVRLNRGLKKVVRQNRGLKKVVCLKIVPFTVFALEMRKREAYKKQAGSNVSALLNKVFVLEHEWFMQGSPYWQTLAQN